jgi:crossover junction endodeoxyribonuclease RuvC
MLYAGIDPGSHGAVSVIDENNEVVYALAMSRENLVTVGKYLQDKSCMVCVEKVGAMPGQGVTSMFNFGKNAGYIEGVLESFGLPYQLIPPQRWKKEFGLIHGDKTDSVRVCKQLFPKANLLPTPRCRKESDGIAESLIMAEYAKRRL